MGKIDTPKPTTAIPELTAMELPYRSIAAVWPLAEMAG